MSDPTPIVGVLLLLAGLLLVYVIVFGGLRRLPGVGVSKYRDAEENAFTVAFSGVTTALALQVTLVFVHVGGGLGGLPSGIGIGIAAGVFFGAVERQRRWRDPYTARLARRVVEAVVGLLAAVPVTGDYFAHSTSCTAFEQPVWLDVLLFAGVALALACAIVLAVLRTATGRLFALLDVTLAYFAALELTVFFVSPFGLSLADLSSIGWVVSLVGVLLVLAATALSPRLVVPAAGAVLAVVTITVEATTGAACESRSFGGIGVLAAYGAAFLITSRLGSRRRRR